MRTQTILIGVALIWFFFLRKENKGMDMSYLGYNDGNIGVPTYDKRSSYL